MAKKRTKADKIRAATRTQEVLNVAAPKAPSLQNQPLTISLPNLSEAPKTVSKTQALWRFNPSLIYQDLLKTALASAGIVGILVLIYWLSF